MNEQLINGLSKEQNLQWAVLSFENAERHIRCAKKLKKSKEFGIAVSHLVLSAEEAIKAFVIWALAHGFITKKEEYSPFLWKHLERHKMARSMTVLMWPIQRGLESALKAKKEIEKGKLTREEAAEKSIMEHLSWLQGGYEKDVEYNSKIQFWKEANSLKNRGLYVDCLDGEFFSPDDFNSGRFDEVYEVVRNYVDGLKLFSAMSNDDICIIKKFAAGEISQETFFKKTFSKFE
jgi:AbiV family abortive infection protein